MCKVTDFFSKLGPLDEVISLSRQTSASVDLFASNSHIHLPPNFSAFETIEQAVYLAAKQGIRILGASNYYDFSVYQQFTTKAQEKGIFPLYLMVKSLI